MRLGHFSFAHAQVIPLNDNSPLARRQRRKRLSYLVFQAFGVSLVFDRAGLTQKLCHALYVCSCSVLHPANRLFDRVECGIGDGAQEVRREGACFIKLIDALVNANEDFLSHVLGQLFVMRDEVSGLHSLPLVAGYQYFQPAQVAGF